MLPDPLYMLQIGLVAFVSGAIGSVLVWILLGRPIVKHEIGKWWDGITNRMGDPKDEEMDATMTLLMSRVVRSFRIMLKDPQFNKDFNEWTNGYMTGVSAQIEKRLPKILLKVAKDIKEGKVDWGEEGGGTDIAGNPLMQMFQAMFGGQGGGGGGFNFPM